MTPEAIIHSAATGAADQSYEASAELPARARVLLPPVALVAFSVVTNFTLQVATLI